MLRLILPILAGVARGGRTGGAKRARLSRAQGQAHVGQTVQGSRSGATLPRAPKLQDLRRTRSNAASKKLRT